MADILKSLIGLVQRYRDMGDGTYAEVVAGPTGSSSTHVQGSAADGAAAVGNPVQAGGVDGSGNVQSLLTDTTGAQVIVGGVASGATDSGNPVKVGGVYTNPPPTYTTGQRAELQQSARGSLRTLVQANGSTGTDALSNTSLGFVGTDTTHTNSGLLVVAGYEFNGTSWDRVTKPNSTSRLLSAAGSTNATSVKAAAGKVYKITLNVIRASDCFLKLYNKASAPTVGTDTPVLTLLLPLSTKNVQIPLDGQYFSTGIAYAITTAAADADTGALTAGDVTCLNITYA